MKTLAILFATTLSLNALARPLTPSDLVSLSEITGSAVSKDGRWLVWDQREADAVANRIRHFLWRLDLTGHGAAQKLALRDDADETQPAFGSDGALYFLSSLNHGNTALWRVDMSGGAPTQITGDYDLDGFKLSPAGNAVVVWADRRVGATSLDDNQPNAAPSQGSARIYDRLFVRHWDTWEDGRRSQLFVIPMLDGRALGPGHAIEGALIGDAPQKPAGGAEQVAWSLDGHTVYFALREAGRIEPLSTNLDIFSSPADGSAAPTNLTRENPATDSLPSVSPDGRWLAWTAMRQPGYDTDRQVLMLRDLASGTTRALTQAWDRSVDSITWATNSAAVYVTADDSMDKPVFRIDRSSGEVRRLTAAGHASQVLALPRGGFVFTHSGLTQPTDIWRFESANHLEQLTHINADRLAGIDWPTVTRFTFAGADGDTVHALAMRPAHLAAGTRLPVAFFVHGDPQSSFGDLWSFRWNPSIWAAHGYAVVSVDFHGSTGYGQAFMDSVHSDWGGKPLVDLQAGLKAATEQLDFLDASRVCALGGSYGGYMMNWIEGMWPDRFKCLVQHDGVFDSRAMAYETDELWPDEWDHGGHPYYEAPNEFEKWNPVNHVDRWKTPQLVITSEKDFRSPYTQGIAAFTALQRRGVPSRLMIFPDENHLVSKPRNSLQWNEEVLQWMDRWTRR